MRRFAWLLCICFSSYASAQADFGLGKEPWRATLTTPGGDLPFLMKMNWAYNQFSGISIRNGDESIQIDPKNIKLANDSLHIQLPVFNTEIIAAYTKNKEELNGYWYDYSRNSDYKLPFHADKDAAYRFKEKTKKPYANLSGKWEAIFTDADGSTEKTVGIFSQTGNRLLGTFLTTTGDYRYLEGYVSGKEFGMSCFDGSHAFLFIGTIQKDKTITGNYWSGKHYHATFTAKRNDTASLPDPKSLTYLKSGYSKIDFCFPDSTGKKICLADSAFTNKVVIIQIMGSWCPNCMDETAFLSDFYPDYKNQGVEIIGLAFERQTDMENFRKNIGRLAQRYKTTYTIVNAGSNKNASDALPMLNHIMGFPTTIILDRNHNVQEIYTGFNGPATGQLFQDYQNDFYKTIDTLVK